MRCSGSADTRRLWRPIGRRCDDDPTNDGVYSTIFYDPSGANEVVRGVTVTTTSEIPQIDVYFLVDATPTLAEEIVVLQAEILTIIDDVQHVAGMRIAMEESLFRLRENNVEGKGVAEPFGELGPGLAQGGQANPGVSGAPGLAELGQGGRGEQLLEHHRVLAQRLVDGPLALLDPPGDLVRRDLHDAREARRPDLDHARRPPGRGQDDDCENTGQSPQLRKGCYE